MNIKPLGDRIVVERIEQEEKTAGGIIIPDSAKEKPKQAKVLAVGAGAKDENGKRIPVDVAVGDIVLFTQWAGNEIKLDGKDLLVLKESDVIGIIEGASAGKKAA
ncbi:MAG: co-chaperone GroES [Alphaproteobacteria bacterium]|nr:co-chaperone GroES [Alphaproteobacteria bacterium]